MRFFFAHFKVTGIDSCCLYFDMITIISVDFYTESYIGLNTQCHF